MSKGEERVSFLANGRSLQARPGQSLLDALAANGFQVPALCHLPGVSPYGACRLCLVEIHRGGRQLITTSCNYPVQEGLEVFLDSERVIAHRRVVLELILSMAPDAPGIRALAESHGVSQSRFATRIEPENCILCGLCARVCRELVRAEALTLAGRGNRRVMASRAFDQFPESCIGCGACDRVCPTRAISMEEKAVARLKDRWGEHRPCRYALMGLTPGASCENDYACASCEVDQRMVDRSRGLHPIFLARGLIGPQQEGP